MPKKLMKDREVHGVEYKMLRHDPVQAEWEIIGKLAAEPRQKPSIKMEAGESLTLMYYHQKMMKHPRKKGSCADWQNSEKDLQEENDRVEVIHENRNHREGQPTTIAADAAALSRDTGVDCACWQFGPYVFCRLSGGFVLPKTAVGQGAAPRGGTPMSKSRFRTTAPATRICAARFRN